MEPEQRKRVLINEVEDPFVDLMLFSEYKKSSCHFENVVFGLLKEFGCLPYFMPKIPDQIIAHVEHWFRSNDTITCDALMMKIMAEKIAFFSARSTGIEDPRFITTSNSQVIDCPDECDSTKYGYQVSYAEFEDNGDFFLEALLCKGNKTSKAVNDQFFAEYERYVQDRFAKMIKPDDDEAWDGKVLGPPQTKESCVQKTVKNKIRKMTYLHVYFNNFGVTKFTKSQLYGWQDLIGVFGGIVGLCMGFSLLSAAELIYFFTIRLWVDDARNKAKKKPKKGKAKMDQFASKVMNFE